MKRIIAAFSLLLLVGAGCSSAPMPTPSSPPPHVTPPSDDDQVGTSSDEAPAEDRTYSGVVTFVDLHQMMVDGPGIVMIRTDAGAEAKILVPARIGLCKAKDSVADVSELKAGQTVEARGSLGEDGAIIPCESEAHYLRVTKK